MHPSLHHGVHNSLKNEQQCSQHVERLGMAPQAGIGGVDGDADDAVVSRVPSAGEANLWRLGHTLCTPGTPFTLQPLLLHF